jgi:hypothetical protein
MKDEDYPNDVEESEDSDKKGKHGFTREEYERVKKAYLEDKNKPKQKPFAKFFPSKKKSAMKKSLKKPDQILVFLLNLKKQIEGPILVKIYGGNFMVIRNHVYRFNPDRVFSFSKYKAVIAREFDRELVGIDDYKELVMQDFISNNPGKRVNIDDPVLIKALIQARLSEKPKTPGGMKWIIIVLAVIGLIVGFFLLTSKKKVTTTTPTPVPVNATG